MRVKTLLCQECMDDLRGAGYTVRSGGKEQIGGCAVCARRTGVWLCEITKGEDNAAQDSAARLGAGERA